MGINAETIKPTIISFNLNNAVFPPRLASLNIPRTGSVPPAESEFSLAKSLRMGAESSKRRLSTLNPPPLGVRRQLRVPKCDS